MNKSFRIVYVLSCLYIIALIGCGPLPAKKPITQLYMPDYMPNYTYQPSVSQSKPSGYTAGIIQLDIMVNSAPPNSVLLTPTDKQYVFEFVNGFSSGLENILVSKGVTVAGPFESYEEMTYPERSRCNYLIKPTVTITFSESPNTLTALGDYSGPHGEWMQLAQRNVNLKAAAQLEYVILDPLTQEKLERHTLKTNEINKSYLQLFALYSTRNEKKQIIKQEWKDLGYDPQTFPGYRNREVAMAEITEALYQTFMGEIEKLVSIEEFEHLNKYQDELRERKRY